MQNSFLLFPVQGGRLSSLLPGLGVSENLLLTGSEVSARRDAFLCPWGIMAMAPSHDEG